MLVAPCPSSSTGRRNRGGKKSSPGDTKARGGRSQGVQGHGEKMLLSI